MSALPRPYFVSSGRRGVSPGGIPWRDADAKAWDEATRDLNFEQEPSTPTFVRPNRAARRRRRS